jgi:hypothetical protein
MTNVRDSFGLVIFNNFIGLDAVFRVYYLTAVFCINSCMFQKP